MKKITGMFLFVAMIMSLFTGCVENTAGEKSETAAPTDGIQVDFGEGSGLRKLTIKGGETVEMDDILKKKEEFSDKYGPLDWLVISPEVKHIKPPTEKTKDFDYELRGLSGLSLRAASLSPRDIYSLLNALRVDTVHVTQGEDVKEFDFDDEVSKFYKYYFPNMQSQNGLYIEDGILFGYDEKVTRLLVPDSVTAIAPEACSAYDEENEKNKLKAVTLSDSVIEIGWNAFEYQPIKELMLGNSVRVIGEGAFYNTEIKRVRIPESVDTIGEEAFCAGGLEKVEFEGSTKNFAENISVSVGDGGESSDEPLRVVFYFSKGIKEAITSILDYDVKWIKGKTPYYRTKLSWIPVNEADGYDICVCADGFYEDGDDDKYVAKKTVTGKTAEISIKHPAPECNGSLIGLEVTPFKYINGKKVYGRCARYMGEDDGVME